VRLIVASIAFTVIACGIPRPVRAQTESAPSSAAAESEHGEPMRFIRDVAGDHRNFFSRETAVWLGTGLGAVLDVHAGDVTLAEEALGAADGPIEMRGGGTDGYLYVQVPLASLHALRLKVGVPAFAIGSYTAASRVVDNKRRQQAWASDFVLGAALGMTRRAP
jgi:hypothetical protein